MTGPADELTQLQNNEIDLLELWDVLWSSRQIIVAVTSFFAVASIIYALTRTEIYRAEALLAPAVSRESTSPLVGQLGGAAALVGIDLGQAGGSQVGSVLATLRSREFILSFVDANGLRESLFPGSADDSESPTDWQVYRTFSGMLKTASDSGDGLIRLSIESPDPVQAAHWVNLVVEAINAHEKARDVEEATSAIAYLQGQLSSTQLVEMQRVFYQLIESQTRVVMLADVRDEYVFRVIDPAVVPDRRISPQRTAIVIAGTLMGGLLAVLFVLFRYLSFKRRIFSRQLFADRKP
jgi:uncharacterized protein involved in exopolysaccharide biosynthesis